MNITYLVFAPVLLYFSLFGCWAKTKHPLLQHAKIWQHNLDLSQYLVSEKYDGVRARWTGQKLISRNGNEFLAPKWFIAKFPKVALDGELWAGRGKFEQTLSIVKQSSSINNRSELRWRQLQFMVFDLPDHQGHFSQRLEQMRSLISHANSPYLTLIPQSKIKDKADLMALLEQVVGGGGEGLMLHYQYGYYEYGRSSNIFKLKPFDDGDGVVTEHHQGKGKFSGMLGSLTIRLSDGQQIKIGSGFSQQERESPPPIGAVIRFKYFGKTAKGKPRFASYIGLAITP
ncbi:DNA ligase [Thalassotalea aquiviva]|uniref:DNA ligase n=1 Tax=Thalassotalea aquiviva TaxID=3242415 RepID=UPI00352B81BA